MREYVKLEGSFSLVYRKEVPLPGRPGPSPLPVTLSPLQRSGLERLTRRHRCPQSLVRRAQIVLLAAEGSSNTQIVERLGVVPNTPTLWRSRWQAALPRLDALEAAGDEKALAEAMEAALSDEPRPGTPATFTPEQIVQIVAVALEDPEECGRPVSHWTPTELAEEAKKRGIVERISPRQVGRFLKGERPQTAPQPVLAQPADRRSRSLQSGGEDPL